MDPYKKFERVFPISQTLVQGGTTLNWYAGQILLKIWLRAHHVEGISHTVKTNFFIRHNNKQLFALPKTYVRNKSAEKPLLWTHFRWTKVEKFGFNGEIAILQLNVHLLTQFAV